MSRCETGKVQRCKAVPGWQNLQDFPKNLPRKKALSTLFKKFATKCAVFDDSCAKKASFSKSISLLYMLLMAENVTT